MHSADTTHAADESIDPSARKKLGPQDAKAKNSSVTSVVKDVDVFRQAEVFRQADYRVGSEAAE